MIQNVKVSTYFRLAITVAAMWSVE